MSGGSTDEAYARQDQQVADFWDQYAAERGRLRFAARHPVTVARAVAGMRSLPLVTAHLSRSGEGRAIDGAMRRPGLTRKPFVATCAAVLSLPVDPAAFLEGRRMQTMRRKLRQAGKAGISVRTVTDPTERDGLLALANEVERGHPDPEYRVEHPRNDDLLACSLWLAAVDAEGATLMLGVLPVDGEWASLRYFRTLGHDDVHSLSRWATTEAMVRELTARGVRHLLDPEHPGSQKPGVRHFQRMVGFRFARIQLA